MSWINNIYQLSASDGLFFFKALVFHYGFFITHYIIGREILLAAHFSFVL